MRIKYLACLALCLGHIIGLPRIRKRILTKLSDSGARQPGEGSALETGKVWVNVYLFYKEKWFQDRDGALCNPHLGSVSLCSSPTAGPLWLLFLKQRSGFVLICFYFPEKGQRARQCTRSIRRSPTWTIRVAMSEVSEQEKKRAECTVSSNISALGCVKRSNPVQLSILWSILWLSLWQTMVNSPGTQITDGHR